MQRSHAILATILAASLGACAEPQGSTAIPDRTSPTRVVLLGTGTPNADPSRSGPALAVIAGGEAYLVDAGPGVVRRAAAAAEKHGIAELAPERLRRVFLTHLHSDHTVGLPDLIFTPWVLERRDALAVYGPPGTKSMCEHLVAAFAKDVEIRTEGLERANPTGWRVDAHEIEAGVVYRDANVTVTAIKACHGSIQHAFAFKLETADRVIVVSGDTGPCAAITEAARDADVLVHEVYSHARFAMRPPQWQKYHASFHTSTVELAAIAREAKPKLLVLTHLLMWGATPDEMLAEVRAGYDGPVACGADLDVF